MTMATMHVLLTESDLELGLRPAHVSVGDVVYPPGGRLGPRWQEDVELVLVHSGSARVSIDGGAPAMHLPGSVRLLLPGHRERFEFADDRPTHHSWVQLRMDAPPDALMARLRALPVAIPASAALTDLVREAVATARTPLSTGNELVASLAVAALWRYVGEGEVGTGGASDVVDLARAYMHSHLTDPGVDLRHVAQAAHVTPAHLVRRFRAEVGTTPIAYLWRRRVAVGIDLLTNTGLPVGDIAARSGFKSVYHFSRRVKEETGLPPTEVRRERWKSSTGGLRETMRQREEPHRDPGPA
jgi:AraC-like DNA-binding protein